MANAQTSLVIDGQANAQIILADDAPRLTKLAASELQKYIRKISGAQLAITPKPDAQWPVKIYVGQSSFTDSMGITDEGLQSGAFRIVTKADAIVLLGHDFDFQPVEPWGRNRKDEQRAQKELDDLTGSTWVIPMTSIYKNHLSTGLWAFDAGGSFNAVCEFLRMQGVRWYMMGELGEVVPERKTITVPAVNKTVHPDFPIRNWFPGLSDTHTEDGVMWELHLGMNSPNEVLGVGPINHGLRRVHGRDEMKEAHPEYYALRGGKRELTGHEAGHPCMSSQGLFNETVKYARFLYDHYHEPAVSIWPNDGFVKCQCDLCRDNSASELVWGFVQRVATELYKTHPDRWVTCGAYGSQFSTPPSTIDKFSPNVLVFIASVPRPGLDSDEQWNQYQNRIQSWVQKLGPGQRLVRNSNNRYYVGGNKPFATPIRFPVIHPHAMARDLHGLKGISLGDHNEVSRTSRGSPSGGHQWRAPGLDHLTLYVQSQFLWNADQDIEALLNEYYPLFYGPAAGPMKAAFEFAETNYRRDGKGFAGVPMPVRVHFLEMLHDARNAAGDTVYGKRIDVILSEMQSLEETRKQMKEAADRPDPRVDAPVILADGKTVQHLKQLATGQKADIDTTFQIHWEKDELQIDIRCDEPDMANIHVTSDVWGGDSVALLLESASHAYYQIEINPDGKIFDADRSLGINKEWDSQAIVKTIRGSNFWVVQVRLPIINDEEGEMDPLHRIVGGKPTKDAPWYFNIGRKRVRQTKIELYGFSPSGSTYHVPEKFAKLYVP